MQRSKIETFLGFARRAGKLTLGVHAAGTLRRAELLVADESVAPNNRKEIEKLQKKFGCELIFVQNLEGMTNKAQCKLAAVRDKNLAEAIKKAHGECAPKTE